MPLFGARIPRLLDAETPPVASVSDAEGNRNTNFILPRVLCMWHSTGCSFRFLVQRISLPVDKLNLSVTYVNEREEPALLTSSHHSAAVYSADADVLSRSRVDFQCQVSSLRLMFDVTTFIQLLSSPRTGFWLSSNTGDKVGLKCCSSAIQVIQIRVIGASEWYTDLFQHLRFVKNFQK